ncbi:hypothetical protein EJB05_14344, partial [Eragrostis curvula]
MEKAALGECGGQFRLCGGDRRLTAREPARARRRPAAVRPARRGCGCAARRGGERKGKPTAAQSSSSSLSSTPPLLKIERDFTSNGQSDRGFFWDFTSNVVVLPMPPLESLTCCLCMELVS